MGLHAEASAAAGAVADSTAAEASGPGVISMGAQHWSLWMLALEAWVSGCLNVPVPN